MFLFLFCRRRNSSKLVIRGKRVILKTLAPKFATLSEMYRFVPSIMETTTISVETERITPSSVRNDRSLCVRNVSRAIKAGSLSDMALRLFDMDFETWKYYFDFNCSHPERRREIEKVPQTPVFLHARASIDVYSLLSNHR